LTWAKGRASRWTKNSKEFVHAKIRDKKQKKNGNKLVDNKR
jgi:hypothetical protein